jgi:hypothetical protein
MTSPLFMQDVTLTLRLSSDAVGARESFQCDAHTAEIVPSAGDEVTYETLCAAGSYSSVGRTTYALHIVAAQRWDATGLARYLWDNDGELADFQYQAHGDGTVPSATEPGMSGQVRLIAGNYGGEVSTYAELEVTLPCTSKPTMSVAAFPAAAEAEAPAEEPVGVSA